MRLEQLDLKNFCQFTNRTFRFQPGMNLIVGPNGSGKSNLLKAAYAAATADFSRNEGKQADNICDMSDASEPSSVGLTFTHAGRTARAVRNLRPAGRSLSIDGGKEITADKEMSAAIYNLIGVTPEILAEYVFVDQWEVFSVFALSEAKRAAAFQRLFRIDKAQKIWDLLGDAASSVRIPAVQSDKDELGRRRDAADAERASLREQLSRAEPTAVVERRIAADRDLIQSYEQLSRTEGSLNGRMTLHARTAADAARSATQIEDIRRDLDLLRQAESDGGRSAAAAHEAIARWREYGRTQQARTRLDEDADNMRREWSLWMKPAAPDDYLAKHERAPLEAEVKSLVEKQAGLQAMARQFRDGAAGNCPTCGASWADVSARMEENRRESQSISSRLDPLVARIDRSFQYEVKLASYEQWLAGYHQRMNQLDRQRAALAEVVPPPLSEDEARRLLNDHSSLQRESRELADELAREERRHGGLVSQVELEFREIERERAECRRLIGVFAQYGMEPSQAATDAARRRLDEATGLLRWRAQAEGSVTALDLAVSRLDDEILRLRRQQDEAVRLVGLRDHLTELRSVLHYSALPKRVSLHNLGRMTNEVNAYLQLFGAPFRVELDDKLTFTAIFTQGNRRRPAGRLSGGQKVVLALAFRLTVNNTFAADLGLLCLDEPTVGLDEANLAALENALVRLRELASSTGLQVVMVTHERSLAPMFDNVIDLYPTLRG